MKLLKHLYKMAYDDIKDAEMILGYAEDAIECGNTTMAKYFAADALDRTKHYTDTIGIFHNCAQEEKIDLDKEALGCVVCHMLCELDDWKNDIVKRLEKL